MCVSVIVCVSAGMAIRSSHQRTWPCPPTSGELGASDRGNHAQTADVWLMMLWWTDFVEGVDIKIWLYYNKYGYIQIYYMIFQISILPYNSNPEGLWSSKETWWFSRWTTRESNAEGFKSLRARHTWGIYSFSTELLPSTVPTFRSKFNLRLMPKLNQRFFLAHCASVTQVVARASNSITRDGNILLAKWP